MSNSAPEKVTSPSAETDSSIGRLRQWCTRHSSGIPPDEIVAAKATATRVESLEARTETNDEEEVIDVVGGGKVGVRSGAESESFTYVDAFRGAKYIAASDPETVLDMSAMPTCKCHLYDNL